jgi:histidine ammonia-lyase
MPARGPDYSDHPEKSARLPIRAGQVPLSDLRLIARGAHALLLDERNWQAIRASAEALSSIIASGRTIYGVNTGFGKFSQTKIGSENLQQLQHNLILSHCTGTGPLLSDETVRLVLALKVIGLARGYSAVRPEIVEALLALLEHEVYPCVPAKGSVGASGDLTPLAHLFAVLIGYGEARHKGRTVSAEEALTLAGLKPLVLMPKEGLALLNGTQVTTALALIGLFAAEDVFAAATVAGAMSLDASKGNTTPLDARIQEVRGHAGQIDIAGVYRRLLDGSGIWGSHQNGHRVQDPYSIRCQPQVMGACLDVLRNSARVLAIEANAVSDNPIVFSDTGEILSGGNFHAEPVGMAADSLAVAIAEIGAISERRIALLVDSNLSGLPPFLTANPGINSGFMVAQISAAALASENKSLAHPATVDSIPTAANQEDHVSMATFAARRLGEMADNTGGVVAIELLAAAQGIDLLSPLATSPALQQAHHTIRSEASALQDDRPFAPDIERMKRLIEGGFFMQFLAGIAPSQAAT